MKRTLAVLGLGSAVGLTAALVVHSTPPPPPRRTVASAEPFAPSPAGTVRFERNDGQTDGRVRFLHRGGGGVVFLTDDGTTTRLRDHALRMRFEGARGAPRVSGDGRLASYSNYFIGNDPALWRSRVPHYAAVHYDDVYPGIGVVYHGRNGSLEYDFEVAPGADPGVIALSFEGADSVRVDADGDLVLVAGDSEVRHGRPLVFQDGPDGRTPVDGRFVLDGATAHFEVAEYDRALALVIDPIITFSTYLGGSGVESGYSNGVDAAGNAYVCGSSVSADFPTTPGVIDTVEASADGFVTKYDPTGAVVFSTYLGGDPNDTAYAVAADASGNAYVAGSTIASDFPVVGGFQSVKDPTSSIFVTKISPDGTSIVYSSFLGGDNLDTGMSIAVDASGAAYLTGWTWSSDFPTAGTPYQSNHGGGTNSADLFVAKVAPSGSALVYSTYVGGSGFEARDGASLFLDGSGCVYVTTDTTGSFPTTTGAFQETFGGGTTDGALVKLDANGSSLVFSTYVGGSDADTLTQGGLDAGGNVWVAGQTLSTDMPVASPFQAQSAGERDIWVGRLDAAGANLLNGSYYGGTLEERCRGAGVDAAGNLFVTGEARSMDLIQVDPLQPYGGGVADAFVLMLRTGDSSIGYSTYLGGSVHESPGTTHSRGLSVEPSGAVLVTGSTGSPDFPRVGSTAPVQSLDAYLTRISPGLPPPNGDGTLYASRGAFKINHAQHTKDNPKDSFQLKGCLNPAGASANPTGASVALSVGGTEIIGPITLDKKGRGKTGRGVKPAVRVQFKPSNGQFLAQIKSADLRIAVGDLNVEAKTLTVSLTVANAGLLTDTVSGDLDFSIKTKVGKSSRGAYSFAKSTSRTAVYKANRAQASEDKSGAHTTTLRTWIAPDGGGPIVPTGDIEITLGDATRIVLPLASLAVKGSGDTVKYSYSRSLGEVPELKKFTLDNRRKSLTLTTEALVGTGIPPGGAAEPTSHTLDVRIRIETAAGTTDYGSTIELLRPKATTGRWKR